METLLMDHNLLGLVIPFFLKVVVTVNPFDKSPKKIFSQALPLSSPCSSLRTQGSTWVFLGWAEAIGCERNNKLCGRIVLEPDDVHLHGGDDEEEDYDV